MGSTSSVRKGTRAVKPGDFDSRRLIFREIVGFLEPKTCRTMNRHSLTSNRRDFLKTASAATLGALAAGAPTAIPSVTRPAPLRSTADSVIVLWMGGGMASTETFDPKHYAAFEPGMNPDRVLSTFPAIDSAADHIKLTEGLEEIASQLVQHRRKHSEADGAASSGRGQRHHISIIDGTENLGVHPDHHQQERP